MASPPPPLPPYKILQTAAQEFPNLVPSEVDWASQADEAYNCIGWVVGDTQTRWWPLEVEDLQHLDYWPDQTVHPTRLDAFRALFVGRLNYVECPDGSLEAGFEKLAMYTNADGEPTHMARQVTADLWWSKVGRNEDIRHELGALEGPLYGRVTHFFRRPIAPHGPTS